MYTMVVQPGWCMPHPYRCPTKQANYVVVDEVDTMLTQGFAADIEKLTRPMLSNPERREKAQFVFVTATLTKAVRKLLEDGNYPKVSLAKCKISYIWRCRTDEKIPVPRVETEHGAVGS